MEQSPGLRDTPVGKNRTPVLASNPGANLSRHQSFSAALSGKELLGLAAELLHGPLRPPPLSPPVTSPSPAATPPRWLLSAGTSSPTPGQPSSPGWMTRALCVLPTPSSTLGFSPYLLLAQCGMIHHLLLRPAPSTTGQQAPVDKSQVELSVPSPCMLPDTMLNAQQGFQPVSL